MLQDTDARFMSIPCVVEGWRTFHLELELATNDLQREINGNRSILGAVNFPLHGEGAMGGAVWWVKALSA